MTGRKRVILATGLADELPPGPVLAPAKAPAYVTIAVRDFGCGIPPANLPRIFEPFFTTKAFSAHRGTGLGLSMVYHLAGKLGAGLAVASVLDQGSTFTLILPAPPSPPIPDNANQRVPNLHLEMQEPQTPNALCPRRLS